MEPRDPKGRFSDRVDDYAKYRPSYPSALIEAIIEPLEEHAVVADIGSGTGILTGLLLDRNVAVCAVEPNEPMRNRAELIYGDDRDFQSVDGSAEETTLPTSMSGATCCAQSFHWFATRKAAHELQRITKPRGSIWIIWNVRSVDAGNFSRDYASIIKRYSPEYAMARHEDINTEMISNLFHNNNITLI